MLYSALYGIMNRTREPEAGAYRSCRFDELVRDGCLFERALEHCLSHKFQDADTFVACVQELARQLSFGRLCKFEERMPDLLNQVFEWPLGELRDKRMFEKQSHFMRFALDLWTGAFLQDDAPISDAIGWIRRIAHSYEAQLGRFRSDPWLELELIKDCHDLPGAAVWLSNLRPQEDGTQTATRSRLPQAIREAIVQTLMKLDNFPEQDAGLEDLKVLLCNLEELYGEGLSVNVEAQQEPQGGRHQYSLYVRDLKIERMPETGLKILTDQINHLCEEDFDFPVRAYVAPGSLWVIICADQPLPTERRNSFRDRLLVVMQQWSTQKHAAAKPDDGELLPAMAKSILPSSSQEQAPGYLGTEGSEPGQQHLPTQYPAEEPAPQPVQPDPTGKFRRRSRRSSAPNIVEWRPLHSVPYRTFGLVRQFETLLDKTCDRCICLRASDLRELVAKQYVNPQTSKHGKPELLDPWKILVFEDLDQPWGRTWTLG